MADREARRGEFRGDMMASVAHDGEETDEDWSHGSQESSDGRPHQAPDYGRGSSISLSERSRKRVHVPEEAGSSSQNSVTPPVIRVTDTQMPRNYDLPIYSTASQLLESEQNGVKRHYPPTSMFTDRAGSGSASTIHPHVLTQETPGSFRQAIGSRLPEGGAHSMGSKSPGLNLEENIAEDDSRHSKRSRRAQASVIHSTEATSRLENQMTSLLLRPHGRAGDEIPQRCLETDLYNGLLARIGTDLDATADLQNLLNIFDMPVRAIRERSDHHHLSQAITTRRLPRSLLASQSSDPSTSLHSYLPPLLPLGSKSLIYLSEVLPRSLDQRKRSELLAVFRTKASYVPACINLASGLLYGIQYHVRSTSKSYNLQPTLPLGQSGRGWPINSLPLEVFHIISNHLPRDALQNMRLVNREFESKISNALFRTVVVPFRPEIYGMIVQQHSVRGPMAIDVKGKGRELPVQPEGRIHDGMRTFQGWGPHIKKFAMAFEVEESTLENPPEKGRYETHGTFWGCYRWPHPMYNRYEYCEDLEKKADEFRCMSAAISNLTGVTELGLSIDSGLGWLSGPDVSDRARLLREKPRIFGKSQHLLDTSTQLRHDEWNQEVNSIFGSPREPGLPVRNGYYEASVDWPTPLSPISSRGPLFNRTPDQSIAPESLVRPLMFGGVNLRRLTSLPPSEERPKSNKTSSFSNAPLIPNSLSGSQQEWLLEIEWAQRAFIASFCMALNDNSLAFSRVTTLNIARLSSRHLPSLQRKDFWKALQNLNNLTIQVSADWRNILKTATGSVEAPAVNPSMAATQLYDLLKSHISGLKNIKALTIGYVGGGEQQTGIHGRNKHVLPAPLVDYSNTMVSSLATGGGSERAGNMLKDLLILKHVENLTLTNCWFSPLTLKMFCSRMRAERLKTLTLNSVSLCYQSTFGPPLQALAAESFISSIPQGPPRYGEPVIADFFELRPSDIRDPEADGWVNSPQRIGSWGQVMDFVTPGPNLDFVRYAYQYIDDDYFGSLKRPDPQALESITFESCGYVHLPNFSGFQQGLLAREQHAMPAYLTKRASELAQVSMDGSQDTLLGEIVTTFPIKEIEVLETGFPMVFGWADKAKADDCLEDGQPIGGSGRFSGKIQRLTYPSDTDDETT